MSDWNTNFTDGAGSAVIPIRDLANGLSSIEGVVRTRSSLRTFGDGSKGVFTVVVQDSMHDSLAISVWQTLAGDGGVPVWDNLAINNYVKLTTVKITDKRLDQQRYTPQTSSQYEGSVDGKDLGPDGLEVTSFLTSSWKSVAQSLPPGMNDAQMTITQCIEDAAETHVATTNVVVLLAKPIEPPREILAKKNGAQYQLWTAYVLDKSEVIPITIWDQTTAELLGQDQPLKRVIYLTDVELKINTFAGARPELTVGRRTVVTLDANDSRTGMLRSWMQTARRTGEIDALLAKADSAGATTGDVALAAIELESITTDLSVRDSKALLALSQKTVTGVVAGVFSMLEMDSVTDFVSRACSGCKERIDEFATSCNVCTDAEVIAKYRLKGTITDTAETVECVVLAEACLTLLGTDAAQFFDDFDDERAAQIKNQLLFTERSFKVAIETRPSSNSKKPRLVVLEAATLNPKQCARAVHKRSKTDFADAIRDANQTPAR